MVKFLERTQDDRIGIVVDGRVGKGDVRALADLLREAIEKHGRIRLLIQLESLPLLGVGAFWEDLKFTLRHARDIERTALVGDAVWHGPYVRIMGPFVPGEVRHFGSDHLEDAWRWVEAA